MRARTVVLAVIGASLALTFACTTASVVGENPSPAADAAPDVTPDVVVVPDAAPDTAPADATADADADAGCIDLGGTGSSGTSSGCLFGTAYNCGGTRVSITCECPAATCRCATGGTFAHDCAANGCRPTTQEREQCGVPEPTPSDGGGSSGSTASSSNG